MDDERLAGQIAATAGDLLVTFRASGLLTGKALGSAGDALAQTCIAAALSTARPADAVLSEEGGVSDAARLQATRVWIVDPLDGTREYAEGRADWAVHVALVVEGSPAVAAVALPDQEERLYLSSEPPRVPEAPAGPLRILVSRTRPPAVATAVADALGAVLVPMGSAGAKIAAVVRGQAHAYLHAGGQYEWDSAAPVGVAVPAGLHASRLDGAPLRYNRPDPSLPDLLVCRPELATTLLSAIAEVSDHMSGGRP